MKTKTVKLDSKTITVTKLPLGKYAELLKALKNIPQHLSGIENFETTNLLEVLPTLIQKSLPDIVEILTITTPLKTEEIQELGLDEIIRIVEAVVEVNNYVEVWATAKKVIAQRQVAQGQITQTTGSPGQ